MALNSLNFFKDYPFDFNIYTHIYLKKSSTKKTNYLALPINIVFIGPYTFKCTIFKGLVICFPPLLGYVIYPQWKLHKPMIGFLLKFMPFIMLLNAWTLFTFRFPSRRYQSSVVPSVFLQLYKIGHIRFMHLDEVYLVQIPWCNTITIISLLRALTMHLFRLNCTFNQFNKSLLTKSKYVCTLCT